MTNVRRMSRRALKVVVVDEDQEERGCVRNLLVHEGLDVVEVVCGRDAMALPASTPPPSLLILTQELTEYAGSDVLAEIERHSAWADVPVIVGMENVESLLAWVLRRGGQVVVSRPFVAGELLAHVRQFTVRTSPDLSRAR